MKLNFNDPDDHYGPDREPAPEKVFTLNNGQQAAFDWLCDFVPNRSLRYGKVLLEGYAGTGKTFLINRVVEAIRKSNPRIAFGMTAPTHKAVRQLKKHSELRDDLDFGTIHSFLGLKEVLKPDPKNRQKMIVKYEPEWNSKRDKKIDSIDVLIVDESSMLRDDLYEHIDDYCRSRPDLKVIFMGDGLQIPPVRDDDDAPGKNVNAIPFVESQRQSRKIHHLVLDEIVRQGADNPIIAYATAIRMQYKNQAIDHQFTGDAEKGVEVVPRNLAQLRILFAAYFDTPEFNADADYMKVVVWRNDTATYFNHEIRLILNKVDTLPRIINGEKLILNKPIVKGEKILLPNNEELEVISHDIVTVPVAYKIITPRNAMQKIQEGEEDTSEKRFSQDFKAYRCTVVTGDEKQFVIDILHEDDIAEFDELKAKIEKSAKTCTDMFDKKDMWKQFYALEKPFANVNYNYCITAHKAQGSTYDYCISMEWDIDQNWMIEERNRIRYVAATRARHKLFIVK